MAEVKKFKTESKKILELMINSIYTNKDVFLRELISNASDAIDKYHYLSLQNDKLPINNNHQIMITIDKENRTIMIEDDGIGMSHDELISSLGTIARSGSEEFVKKLASENSDAKEIEIIGRFGVGFYSAFMVASLVEVKTRSLLSEKGYTFTSNGIDEYTIEENNKETSGTMVILHLREKTEDFDYDKYLNDWQIKNLVKKYSDYIRYPINMIMTKTVEVDHHHEEEECECEEHEPVYEEVSEMETLNSMIPLWKKNKNDISEEDYNNFYTDKFYDAYPPLVNILMNVEGKLEYTALLFIPSHAPYNLYSEDYEKGLQLYSKGVFVMDKCKELIPDYLRFVRGLVDSSDLDLNISREVLQKSKVLHDIAQNLEKKILSRLDSLLKEDRDKYEEFFKNYGLHLKFGIYSSYGMKKDELADLLLYKSIKHDKMITLKEYVSEMKEGQNAIYYASAKSASEVNAMPQADLLKKRDYDCLVLSDNVDEFVMNLMQEYDSKPLKSVNQGDLGLLDEEEVKNLDSLQEQKKPFLDAIKNVLGDKVAEVRISKRLSDSPCCLVSSDGLSFEMEKVLSKNPTAEDVHAEKILELNPNHELFKALESLFYTNPIELNDYADLLYNQALLMEGFGVENPVEFSNKMCKLMVKSIK